MKDERLTISQLRQQLAKLSGIKETEASDFLDAMFNQIIVGLREDGQVRISGLGTLRVQWNEPRKSIDVNTGNEIIINGYNKVTFSPETSIKERVNEPFAHLTSQAVDTDGNKIEEEETPDPILKLGEEAENLLGIIADINSLEKKDASEQQKKPETPQAPEQQETPELSEKTVTPEIPQAFELQEVHVTQNNTANTEQSISSTIDHNFIPPVIDSDTAKPNHSNTTAIVVGIILSVILLLLIVGYFVFQPQVDKWIGDIYHNLRNSHRTEQVEPIADVTANETNETVKDLPVTENDIAETQVTESPITNNTPEQVVPADKSNSIDPMQIVVNDSDAVISSDSDIKAEPEIMESTEKTKSIWQNIANWFKGLFNKEQPTEETKLENPTETNTEFEESLSIDTIGNNSVDIQESYNDSEIASQETEQRIVDFEENSELPDRYEVIQHGVTLAALARKYYHGQTDFWVYIYEANRDLLEKPNSARLGMKIRIPYIDDGDPDIILEAQRRVEEYKK